MELTEPLGYASALLVGLSLGLIGGGGSILTLPILVYLLRVEVKLATAYSLFIVGVGALVGTLIYHKRGLVSWRTALLFSPPSLLAVYAVRRWLMPALPQTLFSVNEWPVPTNLVIMLLFATMMVGAAWSMIRPSKSPTDATPEATETPNQATGTKRHGYGLVIAEGAVVGSLTGIVGAGGGFLIIPALVLFSGLEMPVAIGTSLLIIAAKSLIGFLGDLGTQAIDWSLLSVFTALTLAGIGVGTWLSPRVSAAGLKKGFGWFVLVMAVVILYRELSVLF
jgi:uncharacterized membrane protein YfcA